ncbi:ATP-binding protein [Streptomyces sp. NPDC020983]|uniref:ATP-binding protein n=1 Tax=Streptomyces sp. NPDC020983 TaxID=3365106 RepID=UPI003796B4C8
MTTAPEPNSNDVPTPVLKTWPRSARTVGRTRHALARVLDERGLAHLAETAELVLSELVTNAVNHARPPHGRRIGTRFERLEHGVRIEVHDASEWKPELQRASADDESGRGLALVDALTDGRWGVSARQGPGKVVWAVCADRPHRRGLSVSLRELGGPGRCGFTGARTADCLPKP